MIFGDEDIKTKNLQIISKASLFLDRLAISDKLIIQFYNDQRENLLNLKVDTLILTIIEYMRMSSEIIEILHIIKPNTLCIFNFNNSFNEVKSTFSLISSNIVINFDNKDKESAKLIFLNSQILILGSNSMQKSYFVWKTAIFDILKDIKREIAIIKADKAKPNTFDWIFIPFKLISKIETKGIMSDSKELGKQFAHLNPEDLAITNGFLIPLKLLDQTCFQDKDLLFKTSKSEQNFVKEILKARRLRITVSLLDEIMKIRLMLPIYFPLFLFSFENWEFSSISEKKDIDMEKCLNFIKPKIYQIYMKDKLTYNDSKLMFQLLSNEETKCRLLHIRLKFNYLSECLSALSLLENCTDLIDIYFEYIDIDVKNSKIAIQKAVTEFHKKFGFIQSLIIIKFKN